MGEGGKIGVTPFLKNMKTVFFFLEFVEFWWRRVGGSTAVRIILKTVTSVVSPEELINQIEIS